MGKNYKKLLEFATTIDKNLKVSERNNGESFTHWSDDAPEDIKQWFSDITFELFDHVTDLDEAYKLLSDLVDTIKECTYFEQLRLCIDGADYSDIYNADRLKWLSTNLYRAGVVDDAIQERGELHSMGIFEQIALGQNDFRERITNDIYSAMRGRLSLGEEF